MRLFRRRKVARPERLAKRKRKIFFFKLSIGVALIILLVGLGSWLSHRPYLQITNIIVNGNNVISDSKIKKITETVFIDERYFFLFSRTNSIIFPEEEIKDLILITFKQIKSVDIVRTNFHTISMEIEEHKPYATWCTSENSGAIDNCYFINKEGFVFSKAPNFTGNVFMRFYGDLIGPDYIGKYYLKVDNEFNKINTLINSVKKLKIEPIELHTVGISDMELYLEGESKILFTREQSSSEVLDNLTVILESETFKEKNMEDIEYIDLRFGNKVYFKLK